MFLLRLTIVAAVALSVAAPAAASWNNWGYHRDYSSTSSSSTSTGGTPVPEPSDLALFALGAAGLIAGRWRARR
jgi:hypothetical protein